MARTDRDIIDHYLRENPPPSIDDLLAKLRPLVWVDKKFGATVESVCGRYEVEECQSFVTGVYYRWSLRRGRDAWVECDSIEQGKRLCEADYQSRVRALFE